MRPAFFSLALSACWSENNYLPKLGSTYCSALEECDKGDFDSTYNDHEDCVDDYLDFWEPAHECALDAECEYDPSEAKGCNESIRKADCEDFAEGDWADDCDKIFDCDDDQSLEVAVCLAGG